MFTFNITALKELVIESAVNKPDAELLAPIYGAAPIYYQTEYDGDDGVRYMHSKEGKSELFDEAKAQFIKLLDHLHRGFLATIPSGSSGDMSPTIFSLYKDKLEHPREGLLPNQSDEIKLTILFTLKENLETLAPLILANHHSLTALDFHDVNLSVCLPGSTVNFTDSIEAFTPDVFQNKLLQIKKEILLQNITQILKQGKNKGELNYMEGNQQHYANGLFNLIAATGKFGTLPLRNDAFIPERYLSERSGFYLNYFIPKLEQVFTLDNVLLAMEMNVLPPRDNTMSADVIQSFLAHFGIYDGWTGYAERLYLQNDDYSFSPRENFDEAYRVFLVDMMSSKQLISGARCEINASLSLLNSTTQIYAIDIDDLPPLDDDMPGTYYRDFEFRYWGQLNVDQKRWLLFDSKMNFYQNFSKQEYIYFIADIIEHFENDIPQRIVVKEAPDFMGRMIKKREVNDEFKFLGDVIESFRDASGDVSLINNDDDLMKVLMFFWGRCEHGNALFNISRGTGYDLNPFKQSISVNVFGGFIYGFAPYLDFQFSGDFIRSIITGAVYQEVSGAVDFRKILNGLNDDVREQFESLPLILLALENKNFLLARDLLNCLPPREVSAEMIFEIVRKLVILNGDEGLNYHPTIIFIRKLLSLCPTSINDVKDPDTGDTLLHLVAPPRHIKKTDMVLSLVHWGADITATNNSGIPALDLNVLPQDLAWLIANDLNLMKLFLEKKTSNRGASSGDNNHLPPAFSSDINTIEIDGFLIDGQHFDLFLKKISEAPDQSYLRYDNPIRFDNVAMLLAGYCDVIPDEIFFELFEKICGLKKKGKINILNAYAKHQRVLDVVIKAKQFSKAKFLIEKGATAKSYYAKNNVKRIGKILLRNNQFVSDEEKELLNAYKFLSSHDELGMAKFKEKMEQDVGKFESILASLPEPTLEKNIDLLKDYLNYINNSRLYGLLPDQDKDIVREQINFIEKIIEQYNCGELQTAEALSEIFQSQEADIFFHHFRLLGLFSHFFDKFRPGVQENLSLDENSSYGSQVGHKRCRDGDFSDPELEVPQTEVQKIGFFR